MQSIYIPSSIRDWYLEVKIWATDRQYSFCFWISWTKTIRILTRSTWKHRVLHNTCTKHVRNIKMQCIGSTSKLLKRKDFKFYQTRSNAIILYDTLPAYCIPKVVGMESGEHLRESIHVTSTSCKDLFETRPDVGIGCWSCSTTRWRSCWKIQKFRIKPTKSKPTSWWNGDTRCLLWRKSRARCKTHTFIWWQHELRRWRRNKSW